MQREMSEAIVDDEQYTMHIDNGLPASNGHKSSSSFYGSGKLKRK